MAIQQRKAGQKKSVSAVREFTDREEPRRAFWKRYEKMVQEGSTILTYYGTGGVGKSSILKKLKEEMDAKNEEQGAKLYKYILCNFDDFSNVQDYRTILQDMKMKLSVYGCEFPLFEVGDFYYSMLRGRKDIKEPEVKSLIDQNPTLRRFKEAFKATEVVSDGFEVAASLLDIGEEVAEAIPGFKVVTKLIGIACKRTAAYMENHKELDEAHTEIKLQLDERIKDKLNPNRLYEYLPRLFAQDVEDWEERQREKFVIFLDTYEVIGNETAAEGVKRSLDQWLRNSDESDGKMPGIVFCMPYVLWVIAGRNKLRWGDELEGEMEQHLIEALSYADSNSFLQKAGIVSQELRDGIIRLTGGLPVYLDACVNVYMTYTETQGKEPDISEFGQKRDDVVNRMVKYMDAGTQDMLCALCALKTWTNDMAYHIVPNFSQAIYRQQIQPLSFIQSQEINEDNLSETIFKFDRTVHRILFSSYEKDNAPFFTDIRERAMHYFDKLLKDIPTESRKFAYYLELWADCIVRLTSNADELLTQYETYLDQPVKRMGWRGFDTKTAIVNLFFERVNVIGSSESVPYAFFEYQMGQIKRNRNEYKIAYEYMESAYNKFVKLLGDDDARSIKVLHSLAKMAEYSGKLTQSTVLFQKLVEVCKKKYPKGDKKTLDYMKELARNYSRLDRRDDEFAIYEEILSIVSVTHKEDDEEVLEAKLDVADCLNWLNRKEEATAIRKQVAPILRQKLDEYMANLDNSDNLDEEEFKRASRLADQITLLMMEEDDIESEVKLRKDIATIYKKALGVDDEKTLDAMREIAQSMMCEEDMNEERIAIWREISNICLEYRGDEDPLTLDYMEQYASWAEEVNPEEAEKVNAQLLEIRRRIADENRDYYGEGDEQTIDALKNVASQLSRMNRKEDGLEIEKEILAIRRKNVEGGNDRLLNEKILEAIRDITWTLNSLGQYSDELSFKEEVLSICKEQYGEKAEETIDAMADIAYSLRNLERYEDELKIHKDILAMLREGDDGERTLGEMQKVAELLHENKHYAEELLLRKEVLAQEAMKYGDKEPKTIPTLIKLADTYCSLQQYTEALQIWKQIVEIREKAFHEKHSDTIEARQAMAYVLCLAGKWREALNSIRETYDLCEGSEVLRHTKLETCCVLSVCTGLEITNRYSTTWGTALSAKIMELFSWSWRSERSFYDDCSHGHFFDVKAILEVLRELHDALQNENHTEDAKKCLAQALELCKVAFGEDDKRTLELASVYADA